MNVSLTQKLEALIEKKIKSGLYNNASEVVRDALRRAFCEAHNLDLKKDAMGIAALVRDGSPSRHTLRRKGDEKRLLKRFQRQGRK